MTKQQKYAQARLIRLVESLNPNSREIGAGMIAELQALAVIVKGK